MTEQIIVKTVSCKEVPLGEDFGFQAQMAVEEHLSRVWEHHHAENDGDEDVLAEYPNGSPSVGAFDGCGTCEAREMLMAAIPFLEAGLRREARKEGEHLPPLNVTLGQCPNTTQAINIVFDGPPSHESGRFVEVETDDGKSVSVGDWSQRPDGLWALRIQYLPEVVSGE